MVVICFNGIDGSGKTSQAVRLIEHLRAQGHDVTYVWAGGRTNLTTPFIRFSKRLLRAPKLTSKTTKNSVKTAKQYSNYLSSARRVLGWSVVWKLWLRFTLLEHTKKIHQMFSPHLAANRIIVCDRYIYDSVINTAFLAGLDPKKLPRLLQQKSITSVPVPIKCFYLDVPAEVAYQRKNDIVALQEIAPRVPLYDITASTLKMEVIDGTATQDEIAQFIQNSVDSLLAKNKK